MALGDAFWYSNSLPHAQPDKGVLGRVRDPHQASPPWPKTSQWARPEILWVMTAFCQDGMCFHGKNCGVWSGEGVSVVLSGWAAWGQSQTLWSLGSDSSVLLELGCDGVVFSTAWFSLTVGGLATSRQGQMVIPLLVSGSPCHFPALWGSGVLD